MWLEIGPVTIKFENIFSFLCSVNSLAYHPTHPSPSRKLFRTLTAQRLLVPHLCRRVCDEDVEAEQVVAAAQPGIVTQVHLGQENILGKVFASEWQRESVAWQVELGELWEAGERRVSDCHHPVHRKIERLQRVRRQQVGNLSDQVVGQVEIDELGHSVQCIRVDCHNLAPRHVQMREIGRRDSVEAADRVAAQIEPCQ